MAWTSAARSIADAVTTVLLAPSCAACGKMLESPSSGAVCRTCWAAAECAAPAYEGALREIIHAFKYDGRPSLAAPLAALVREDARDLLRECTCAIPVPLHPWRRLQRGFNQADLLARTLDLPVVHAVWRIRATAPQSTLGAAARRRNVRNVFALSPRMRLARMRRRWLEDRTVILIDDVRTTGATLDACAAVLKSAGVREVRALTVARAAPPRR